MSTEFYWIAVAVVTVLSAGRLTRLAVADDFPPVKFFRDIAYDWLDKGPKRRQWQIITWCAYCAGFWLTAPIVAWGYLSGAFTPDLSADAIDFESYWALPWWIFNGVLAASYLVSLIVVLDKEEGADS